GFWEIDLRQPKTVSSCLIDTTRRILTVQWLPRFGPVSIPRRPLNKDKRRCTPACALDAPRLRGVDPKFYPASPGTPPALLAARTARSTAIASASDAAAPTESTLACSFPIESANVISPSDIVFPGPIARDSPYLAGTASTFVSTRSNGAFGATTARYVLPRN